VDSKKALVLALDLEGTLISNGISQIPRPGLLLFLTRCFELFPRIVMFTTVKEERFRQIATLLVEEGFAPAWFASIEYITWTGKTKDLSFVPCAELETTLLVDDFEEYVHQEQSAQWLKIDCFDYPYEQTDTGLFKMLDILAEIAGRA
jgi:hypothetical protein